MVKLIEKLQEYRDKAYIMNILCLKSSDFFNLLKNILSVPLILSSSVMTILNSSDLPSNHMKIANIVLNGSTVILLSVINNMKLTEKASLFKSLSIKYNKLCHNIEDKLSISLSEIKPDHIRIFIKEYDDLNELLEYSIPNHIKTNVKNNYLNIRTLPNILNCEIDFCKKIQSPLSSIDLEKRPSSENIESSIVYKNEITNMPLSEPKVLHFKKLPDIQIIDNE